MQTSKKLLLTIFILSAILITSCNLPGREDASDANSTAVAETAMAVFTQAAETAAALSPLSTATSTGAPPTFTPTNTFAPTIPPPTATNTPIPCNRASFIEDVTYPDNTEVPAGTTFTKTWRLKNTGSCSWTSGYVLIFDHGDAMSAPATAPVTSGTVAPGATVDVSVDLTAPASPGTYRGHFKLRSPDNIVFGINTDAQGSFWVKIVVPNPTPTPTETDVPMPDLYITEIVYSPAAPHNGDLITVKVSVYNGGNAAAGPFTLQWWTADGAASPMGCDWDIASLVAHGGYVKTCTYTYPSWSTYKTRAVADSANTVAESDETNNTLTQTLVITGP
ncbi:MAG: hypothetical protein B6243_09335 [Anaerolineaceae bacterium 4572_5.2]|nr:MAG: hypothetical protein B6243_09335 [Anaerolineaceae bacterium 4572_5.2]